MAISFSFDLASFTCGAACAGVIAGLLPVWLIGVAIVFLFDLPGPRFSYKPGAGISFSWWEKPVQ